MIEMKFKLVERAVLDPLAESEFKPLITPKISYPVRKVSLFNNTKPNADLILQTIKDQLGGIRVIESEKPAGGPATLEQLKKASQGDVSILALADCGSCTAWVILDAIRLEKEGTPTISICSDKFAPFARKLARVNGLKEIRILEIPHPLAGLKGEEVVSKTREIIPEVKKILNII